MADNANYVVVTDETFQEEVFNSELPVLVDFWAVWCGPCRMVAPVIEELAEEYQGKAKIAKVDVDHNKNTAITLGIQSIPTLLFFKDGVVVDQLVGAVSKATLANKLDGLIGDTPV